LETVLLTGASGFLGAWIERTMIERGERVVRAPGARGAYGLLDSAERLRFLAELAQLARECRPIGIVHAAGSSSVPKSFSEPDCDFFGNVVLTRDVVTTILQHAPDARLVFISSAAVYGQPATLPVAESTPTAPLSPYGVHKRLAEEVIGESCRLNGLKASVLRVFSAYGEGLRKQVVWDLVQKAQKDSIVRLQGTGEESRDFVHAVDVAQAVQLVLEKGDFGGTVYNVASGLETRISDLAGLVVGKLSKNADIAFDQRIPDGTPARWQADISRIESLGFRPTVTLDDGVQRFVDWCGRCPS
jgi:UDP-glucose 4-epimerase